MESMPAEEARRTKNVRAGEAVSSAFQLACGVVAARFHAVDGLAAGEAVAAALQAGRGQGEAGAWQ